MLGAVSALPLSQRDKHWTVSQSKAFCGYDNALIQEDSSVFATSQSGPVPFAWWSSCWSQRCCLRCWLGHGRGDCACRPQGISLAGGRPACGQGQDPGQMGMWPPRWKINISGFFSFLLNLLTTLCSK